MGENGFWQPSAQILLSGKPEGFRESSVKMIDIQSISVGIQGRFSNLISKVEVEEPRKVGGFS